MKANLELSLKGREEVCKFGMEVTSEKELISYNEEFFNSKVHQKELSSSNKELFPNPGNALLTST